MKRSPGGAADDDRAANPRSHEGARPAEHDTRRVRRPFLAAATAFLALSIVAAGCGSRTGLFGDGDALLAAMDAGGDRLSPRDAGEDATPCVPGSFDLTPATAQLMFVLDRSGSMNFAMTQDLPPADLEDSRWRILRNALATTLPSLEGELAIGAKFFPERLTGAEATSPRTACRTTTGVSIPPAAGNLARILKEFDESQPLGGTPTAEALRLAAQDLTSRRTVARTIVLATDGAPNCNFELNGRTCTCTAVDQDTGERRRNCTGNDGSCLDDRATLSVIQDIAGRQNIPVFVVGIGAFAPDFSGVLDRMAVAGGRPRTDTPRYYGVQSAAELDQALHTIAGSVARCTYLTPSAPTDPDAIYVTIGDNLIPRDPTHVEGWDWVDIAYGTIAFFGKSCDVAQAGQLEVSGQVSCEP